MGLVCDYGESKRAPTSVNFILSYRGEQTVLFFQYNDSSTVVSLPYGTSSVCVPNNYVVCPGLQVIDIGTESDILTAEITFGFAAVF